MTEWSIVILLFPDVQFVQVVVKHRFQSQESLEKTVAFKMYSAIKATYLSITNVTTDKWLSYRYVTYKSEPQSHQKFRVFAVFILSRLLSILSHYQRSISFNASADSLVSPKHHTVWRRICSSVTAFFPHYVTKNSNSSVTVVAWQFRIRI